MTTEKAIELLHRLQDEQFDGIHGDERREALEMAIRAMEEPKTAGSGSLALEQPEIKTDRTTGDCINRQQAIEAFEPEHHTDWYTPTIIETLEALPSAQPERKKGMWIKLDMHAHIADHKCTACGEECYVPTCMGEPMYTYCPNCGARMEGESDED